MRWFGCFFAMSVCIVMVGCGASTSEQSASIWSMSQDDYRQVTQSQEQHSAELNAVRQAVDRLASRLDDQQRSLTSEGDIADSQEVMESSSGGGLQWGYQTVSLQASAPDDLKDYLDGKFAALETKVEDSCQCDRPMMSAQASTTLPELFEPPEVTPSVTDRLVSSRIVSVGQPVITSVGQPVTTYSSPMASFSSPVMYSSNSMNCQNGVCQIPQQQSFTYQKSRRRNRR